MPIYEYSCESCGCEFEQLLLGSDQPECPQCGGDQLDRLMSVPAAHSGGSGQLPVRGPEASPPGNCGRPQCGSGGCMGLGGM